MSFILRYMYVLSWASAHTRASPPPPPTNFDSFVVLRVTAHHAKFLRSESDPKVGRLSSHSCDCSAWRSLHGRHDIGRTSKVRTHPSVASFAAFFPCSTKFAYCRRRLNAAETWQRGYESIHFLARYSSWLHYAHWLYCSGFQARGSPRIWRPREL